MVKILLGGFCGSHYEANKRSGGWWGVTSGLRRPPSQSQASVFLGRKRAERSRSVRGFGGRWRRPHPGRGFWKPLPSSWSSSWSRMFIGSTGWPPIDHPPGLRRSRKDLLISLNDLITPKGLRHNGDMRLNTERFKTKQTY
ncbi:hypothetical protein C4D60_Mb08t25060 [Musa balbisiana]|uniref:Uncharacterized protein n=1 Tax=Musa balbisiana TaxID=52838 RepID=A0A4S8K6D3_MUSBA|nr:hypothetical protein C4D60_Mb08t25060 [Musa balbisiana]